MATFPLTNARENLWVESASFLSETVRPGSRAPWKVTKRTLRGGRRDGVDLIEVDNGALKFSIVPTRGMGIWKGDHAGDSLGWDSPVKDGPVNPAFVNLLNWGGLGWLEGFDELLARCGLENNGAPYSDGPMRYTLHGKIANIPAHFVALHLDDDPEGDITIEGHVDEAKLFSTSIRMATKISTKPGSNAFVVRDEFQNLSDVPQEMEILYHWNFGPPFLEQGSRFVAPAKTVAPRDARAVEGLAHYDVYGKPDPGYSEEVYFFELLAKPETDETITLLRNKEGDKAVALRFKRSELPAFTLWKNTSGLKNGYVTGLEPGVNYPNPKPFEKQQNRVVILPPGGSHVAETRVEVFNTRASVAAVEAEIASIQGQAVPLIHKGTVARFSPS